MILPVGTVVTVVARGSRASNGEEQMVPGIVLKQYEKAPGQPVDLYVFHFEGVPSLMGAVPSDAVKIVHQPAPETLPMKVKYELEPA